MAYPAGLESMPMKEVDQGGIDFYTLAADHDKIMDAFQCKGFEVSEFDERQLAQCLGSIESFKQSRYTTCSYYLIVNRIVKGQFRSKLEDSLQGLVASGKTKAAKLLDLEAFLKLVFLRVQREMRAQVAAIFRDSFAAFMAEHRERMQENFYATDVPFQVEGETAPRENPLKFIEEQNVSVALNKNNKRTWTFIVGEFGYGKTSLLLQVAAGLERQRIACLYLPIAQFHETAFVGEKEFLWDVLAILRREDVSRQDERNQVQLAALKELLKKEKRIVLLLDGLDEHPACYREDGLARMFGCIKSFNSTCLFSVRKEFIEDRSGLFRHALRGTFRHDSFTLFLQQWGNPLVLQFARRWGRNAVDKGSRERVRQFEAAVETGDYTRFYGDIPKRPLFLKMVLSDVAERGVRRCNLAELYLRCLRGKFLADRDTSTNNPKVRRPIGMEEDYDYVCGRLFDIMTRVAGTMWTTENSEVRLQPIVEESVVRAIIAEVAGDGLNLASVLLNSVLVPFGKRRLQGSGALTITFAHRSFQEFFLARHVVEKLLSAASDQTAVFASRLPEEVTGFIEGLISILDPASRTRALAEAQRHGLVVATAVDDGRPGTWRV
jgi:hypothetical protein